MNKTLMKRTTGYLWAFFNWQGKMNREEQRGIMNEQGFLVFYS
jgi:hypothetical protein